MKNIALAAVSISLLVAPFAASTQTTAPAKAPAQAPAQTTAAPKAQAAAPAQKAAQPAATAPTAAAAVAKPMQRASHRVPSTADARVCLEFQDNMQVMKCAEKYRYAS